MSTTTKQTVAHTQVQKGRTAVLETEHDFRDALLMASIAVNLLIACLWIATKVTATHESALVQFFLPS